MKNPKTTSTRLALITGKATKDHQHRSTHKFNQTQHHHFIVLLAAALLLPLCHLQWLVKTNIFKPSTQVVKALPYDNQHLALTRISISGITNSRKEWLIQIKRNLWGLVLKGRWSRQALKMKSKKALMPSLITSKKHHTLTRRSTE